MVLLLDTVAGLGLMVVRYIILAMVVVVVGGSLGYVVTSRFRLIQRLVVLGLKTGLGYVAEGDSEEHKLRNKKKKKKQQQQGGGKEVDQSSQPEEADVYVDDGRGMKWEQTGRGDVRCRWIRIKKSILDALYGAGTQVTGVYVDSLCLSLPSLRSHLVVQVDHLRVSLAQVWTPPVPVSGEELVSLAEKKRAEEKKMLLALIDELLWGKEKINSDQGSVGFFGKILNRLKNDALHKACQFAARFVRVEIKNIDVCYMQRGEPGPRPAQCKYSGADGILLKIRRAELYPISGNSAAAAPSRLGEQSSSVSMAQNGPIMMDEPTSWRQAISQLPGLFLSSEGDGREFVSRLHVSGIGLELVTYPETWSVGESQGNGVQPTQSYLFPKYAKFSLKKNQTIKRKSIGPELPQLVGPEMEQEKHTLLEQWEFSITFRISRPGDSPKPLSEKFMDIFDQQEQDKTCVIDEMESYGGERMTEEDFAEDDSELHADLDGQVSESGDHQQEEEQLEMQDMNQSSSDVRFWISCDLDVKAIILQVNIASTGIVERLAGRQSLISKYQAHWVARPKSPVISNEQAWWHHAGGIILSSVDKLICKKPPLAGIEDRRASRLAYQKLYVGRHCRNQMFRDPARRWFQRNTVGVDDEYSLSELAKLENMLSLEEIAHYRLLAAGKYNHKLATDKSLLFFIATKIDLIVSQSHLEDQKPFREVLLHLDRRAGSKGDFSLTYSVSCPKVSIALDTRRHADDAVDKEVPFFVLSVKGIAGVYEHGNNGLFKIRGLEAGPTSQSTEKPFRHVLKSPSLLCHRVCKAADFIRYSVTGKVKAETAYSRDTIFASVHISSRKSVGGLLVGENCHEDGARCMDSWIPGGSDIVIRVAAIGARVTGFKPEGIHRAKALLSLAAEYKNSSSCLRRWYGKDREIYETPPSMYPCLSDTAICVDQLVESACALHGTPVRAPVTFQFVSVTLKCPGIAFQIPYNYRYAMALSRGSSSEKRSMSSKELVKKSESKKIDCCFMFTAVIQNIKISTNLDGFNECFGKGLIHHIEGSGIVDAFSYLSEDERAKIAHSLAPSRFVFDGASRQFTQVASGVSELRSRLREIEIMSMAKVWSYPEDIPVISKGLKGRNTDIKSFLRAQRQNRHTFSASEINLSESESPAVGHDLDLSQSMYPIPIVPYIKIFDLLASAANKYTGMPQIPGESALSAGLLNRGIQIWLSPVQLSHLACVSSQFKDLIKESSAVLENSKGDKSSAEMITNFSPDDSKIATSPNKSFTALIRIKEISMIWMIGTWGSSRGNKPRKSLKNWGLSVKKTDPAFLWAKWIAPLYSVGISEIGTYFKMNGSQSTFCHGSLSGIIARDLQLSELARHAYVLRPLPARAKRIYEHLLKVRREVLGVEEPSAARLNWLQAIARVILKKIVVQNFGMTRTENLSLHNVAMGPQVQVEYKSGDLLSRSLKKSSLSVEIGQMLAYIRLKHQASLVSFVSQMMAVHEATIKPEIGPDNHPKPISGYQSGLRVDVNIVGIDITCRAQSRDLFSLKLQQGSIAIDRKHVSKFSNPQDIKVHMSASVENMLIEDLRASTEHQLVLSPSGNVPYCGFSLIFTSQVDESKYAPRLMLNIQNPRVILLFRFVSDVFQAIGIISSAIESQSKLGDSSEDAKQADTTDTQVTPAKASGSEQDKDEIKQDKPLNFIVQVQNVTLILPTAQTTRTVISSSVDDLVVAIPGNAMPGIVLEEASLPCLGELMEESNLCAHTYLYSDFRRKGTVPRQEGDDEKTQTDLPEDQKKDTDAGENAQYESNDTGRSKKNKRKSRKKSKLSGVLLFEENYNGNTLENEMTGVLRLPTRKSGHPIQDNNHVQDNILAKPAAFAQKVLGTTLGGLTQVQSKETQIEKENGHQDLLVEETEGEGEELDQTPDSSQASMALCVRNLQFLPGVLVNMPRAAAGLDKEDVQRKILKRSMTSHGKEVVDLFEVIEGDGFINPISLAMIMFENKQDSPHQQLHLSLSQLDFRLSAPVFTLIMDFISGNLGDYLHSDHSDLKPYIETKYNHTMHFGPADGSAATFRMTLATPGLKCTMLAHPREWMAQEPEYRFTSAAESKDLLPFFHIKADNAIMHMLNLDSGDTYMNICSTNLDLQDLRLGYRLDKVSQVISEYGTRNGDAFVDVSEYSSSPMAVARRLSNHSQKHKASLTDLDGYQEELDCYKNTDFEDVSQMNYIPLIEFHNVPELRNSLGEDVPSYLLLTSKDIGRSKGQSRETLEVGSNQNIRLEVSVGILHDGTMAIEVALSSAMIQWPYFHDTSLISSLANVFNIGTSEDREFGDHPKVLERKQDDITSWMYINAIVTDTEAFVPVVDAQVASNMISELWNPKTQKDQRNEFERVSDMILATMLIHSAEASGTLSIEDKGISMDASVLRFCYAMGGDGEIVMKSDLIDVALFVRDPDARIHTLLHPMCASLKLKMQQPEAAERRELNILNDAARTIQKFWRMHSIQKRVLDHIHGKNSTSRGAMKDQKNAGLVSHWKLVDKLAVDVASPRTKALLDEYQSKQDSNIALVQYRSKALAVQTFQVHIGVFKFRLAFSHVEFWKSVVDSANTIVLHDTADKPTDNQKKDKDIFRPSGLKIAASFDKIAFVLCNDKPETFGAPDVLQFCFTDGVASVDMAALLPDRPPNAVGHISMVLNSSYLNSGTSKWEPMLNPWPVRAEFLDSNGSNFVSDRKMNIWFSSDRMLDSTFNPASLMSIGDALALAKSFHAGVLEPEGFGDASPDSEAENIHYGEMVEPSARAPQKYLIQNQSGLKLYYWTEEAVGSYIKRSPVIGLEREASDTLKVVPSTKRITLMNLKSAASGTERLGSVINFHFEGNWMPIHDVPINVVGKYKYSMLSPADNTSVPVLVDVILVGRTKIITVHSGIWIENSIEIPISFRLHVPTTSLVPPGILAGKQESSSDADSDMSIGPLQTGEGAYLPLTAALGGLLFLSPVGYQEATRDVIRLSVQVEDLLNQQGYIVCEPMDLPGTESRPLHVSMEVIPSRVLSEFQTFKHLQVIAPGILQRSSKPLEVTISIQPTMTFTNSLPYDIRVLLWQVGQPGDPQGYEEALEEKDGSQSLFDVISPRISMVLQSTKTNDSGQYTAFAIPAGEDKNVYADVSRDILMHLSIEEINLRTVKWSLCNSSFARKIDVRDRLSKISKNVSLFMLDVGFSLPIDPFGIGTYLQRLKDGSSQLRSMHAQMKRETKKAVVADNITDSVARLRYFAKRKSRRKETAGDAAPPQTTKRTAATSARPHPQKSQNTPSAPPYENMKPLGATGVRKKREKWIPSILRRERRVIETSVPLTPQYQRKGLIEEKTSDLTDPPCPSPAENPEPGYTAHRPPPLEVEPEISGDPDCGDAFGSYRSQRESEKTKILAPTFLNLAVHHSMAEEEGARGSVSRLTFHVPYWLNNRTGVDLFYRDFGKSASSAFWELSLPWNYVEVFSPGTSWTEALDQKTHFSDVLESADMTGDGMKIVLMNKQDEIALGLAHVGNRKYSQPLGIKTVGNKGTIELKGPPLEMIVNPSKNRERSLPDAEIQNTDTNESEIQEVTEEGQSRDNAAVAAIGAMKSLIRQHDSKRSQLEDDSLEVDMDRMTVISKRASKTRAFEIAVDVSAAPRNSIFRHTKLVNLKPKYIIENQTGLLLDVKQIGTDDPQVNEISTDEGHRTFSRSLPSGSRAPVYWDDSEMPKEISVRPRLEDEDPNEWHWSGGFPIPDTEWYFGLRIRHRHGIRRYINIPVNVTVGASGSVQVTLKSPASVPPYRIENLCKDVQLFLVQVPLVFRAQGKNYVDSLQPNEAMPYAWDEPTLLTKLRVQAKITGRQESRVADYALDDLGEAPMMLLPTQDGERKEDKAAKRLYRTLSTDLPDDLKQKLVSLLAAEFSKKVYVTVYADGPTRVLRFSDEKNVSSTEHRHVVLDLAFRLKQIENQLRDVNSHFARLSGISGRQFFDLDLYGRFPFQEGSKEDISEQLPMAKSSRKIPISEATHRLIKHASRQVLISLKGKDLDMDNLEDESMDTRHESIKNRNSFMLSDDQLPGDTSEIFNTPDQEDSRGEDSRDVSSFYSRQSRKESKDWGHLESSESAPKTSRRQATFQSSSSKVNMNRRQELLKNLIEGDAILLVGGDMNVTLVQARDLQGNHRSTHSFARVRVRDAVPAPEGESRAKQTSVVWQSTDPIWDEQLVFRDVCVASELVVELWDLGGTRSTKQLNALSADPSEVIKTCRFLGRAEVPLVDTLDVPAMTPIWYPLMRRTSSDQISGKVQMRFHWDITTRGLMNIKLLALESVLAQRREILAALQPIHSHEAASWSKPNPDTFTPVDDGNEFIGKQGNKIAIPTIGLEMFRFRGEDSQSNIAFNPSETSISVMNRHAQNQRERHLVVTILEARGLNPRSGVVVALSDNELPNPLVRLDLKGYPSYATPICRHTLTPRWAANQRHIFRGVDPADAEIVITMCDQRTGIRRRARPLGRGVVHASNLKGERPSYVWVPLYAASKRQKKVEAMRADTAVPDLQVFLRLQWLKREDRGSKTKVELDLAGAGMMVVGGLQDELFNFTMEKIMIEGTVSNQEREIKGSIHRLQVDNQTLNAGEPVVLAPDEGLRPTSEIRPLIKFSLIQSFAGNFSASSSERRLVMVEGCSKVADKIESQSSCPTKAEARGIRSFKKFTLDIDPLHFQTDEVFMESLLSFLSSLPTADIWQDQAWKDQQHRLLTAQFGPKEVEALAINAHVEQKYVKGGSEDNFGMNRPYSGAIAWVSEKEEQDMRALHGQSDLSSWFFIESAEIGKIVVNVSVALSSRVLSAGQNFAESTASDEFSRALGASGYQLVNVSNVQISLGRWVVGNDPSFKGKRTSNGFLSQRALINNLSRHYTRESLKEAHKVLGGAGPAVASVPLTVLWASGSTVVLLHEVTMGKAGPLGVVQQLFYVPFMTISMFLSGFSRMFAAGMALIPPSRIHGDDETVRRLVKRPSNAIEALASVPSEFVLGIRNAAVGFVFDPIAGWHSSNAPGLLVGLGKGIIGLPVRPIIGIFESTSSLTGAIAMTSLGQEGIVGKTLRRVRAPGSFWDDTVEEALEKGDELDPMIQVKEAWQRVLPEFFPALKDEDVQTVMNVRATRVVLITTNHVAYLRARHHRDHSVYKAKWLLPVNEIQNISGEPETKKIRISHVRRFDLKVLGVWPIQMHKGMRCETRSLFEKTVLHLTKIQQAVQSGRSIDEEAKRFHVPTIQDLTVLTLPYKSPEIQREQVDYHDND